MYLELPFLYVFSGNDEPREVDFEKIDNFTASTKIDFPLSGNCYVTISAEYRIESKRYEISVAENDKEKLRVIGIKMTDSTEDPLILYTASTEKVYQIGIIFQDEAAS